MIKHALLILIIIIFALNMGASGIAPSFASLYGARLIKKRNAVFNFSLFVILGAVLLGKGVSATLGKSLVAQQVLTADVVLVILGAATVGLFLANLLKIPQSTSQVTVASIAGAGLYFQQLNVKTVFFKIVPFWVILPALSFALTWLLYRIIYPPEHNNVHIYQTLFANEKKLKISALVASCYVAFAIGTNNVGNAVGPLFGAGMVTIPAGLLVISPLFGLGAALLGAGTLETAGKDIVPLGLFSSTLVSFVTATLLIVASIMGIPQSLVQLNLCSIFAISCLKNGHHCTLGQH
nr:anion permease [Candidatus Omnitrophota bacterium]